MWEKLIGRRVLALTLRTHIQILGLKLAWFQMLFHFGKGEWPTSPRLSHVFYNSFKPLFDHGDNWSEASSFHNRSLNSMPMKTGKLFRKPPSIFIFFLFICTKLNINSSKLWLFYGRWKYTVQGVLLKLKGWARKDR